MRPLSFCMVTTFYPPENFGGDGIFIHRLANALAEDGHEVDVVHCADSWKLLGGRDPAPVTNHPRVRTHPLRSPLGALSPILTQATGAPWLKKGALSKVLAKGHDVVHWHNVSLVGGPKALRLGRGIRLYTTHEHWLVCPTHVLLKNNREPCVEKDCFRCVLAHRRPPQLWRATGMIERELNNIDGFISPSEFTRRRHEAELPIRMEVIPYFLPELPTPTSDEVRTADTILETERSPFFLYVGRLEPLKGVHTLLPLFKKRRDLRLLVAGDGTAAGALKEAASGADNIRFLGPLPRAVLHRLNERARAVLVPSICYEVLGQVIIEGFAARTPAVVRNLGAPPDIVAASGGGLAYDDDAELEKACDLLRDDTPRRRMGDAGYAYYRKHFTKEAHFDAYFGMIRRIASEKGITL